jgi:putative LysE/RhtB family amino acid efflux pump
MSLISYLLKAWIIGIAIAAPVGPIGMLCIRTTLEMGLKGALWVGLGAVLADGCYGLIAVFGLSTITQVLLQKVIFIKIIGGILLLYLAYKELKTKAPIHKNLKSHKTGLKLVSTIFFLTLTNPMTILSFIGIFASLSGAHTTGLESLCMVFGICLGSMSWWLILGNIVVRIKHHLPDLWLHRIKYVSALILIGFGVASLISTLT